jgi:hypothetical protein
MSHRAIGGQIMAEINENATKRAMRSAIAPIAEQVLAIVAGG